MKKSSTIYQLATCALMTTLMCVLGPMSIQIGPIPISFTNFVIYLAVYVLGMRGAASSYVVYLLLGAMGMPVFSGYTGGPGKLVGPTGGYLIGFIIMALICGFVMEKSKGNTVITILGMIAATLVDYFFGTIWFVLQMQCGVSPCIRINMPMKLTESSFPAVSNHTMPSAVPMRAVCAK